MGLAKKVFHNFPHFCAHFLRISSLCQVRADTNLVIEKFYFSICMPPFFYYVQKKMSYAAGLKKGFWVFGLKKREALLRWEQKKRRREGTT